jgi:hypothetical protein
VASRDLRAFQNRTLIADLAARLMAEHGIRDYALAKRKAARQLGLPEGQGLPSNEEVDNALSERQSLFEPEELAERLAVLRRQALEVMRVFARFEPFLTGGVASGVVAEHSAVELEIIADASKEFEQFLVNREIEYKVQDRGGRMAYLVYSEPEDVMVRLIAGEGHRMSGSGRPRMNLSQLEKLLDGKT